RPRKRAQGHRHQRLRAHRCAGRALLQHRRSAAVRPAQGRHAPGQAGQRIRTDAGRRGCPLANRRRRPGPRRQRHRGRPHGCAGADGVERQEASQEEASRQAAQRTGRPRRHVL
ncbi:hypothetical protein LPJ75_003237, partial [Coemansia sp. RSA 2598]